jgi:type IV fimbrial biogenesis protein FimT
MKARGVTLIELLIALAIAGMLLLAAVPLYTQWVADNQISNGAELVAQGLRLAQTEAIRRNLSVEFVFDPTTGSGGWTVQEAGGATIQQATFSSGSSRVDFAVSPGGTNTLTFTSLGTVALANADGTAPLDTIDISSSVSGTRALRVLVGGGRSGVKVCDPAWNSIDATDPKACPTG